MRKHRNITLHSQNAGSTSKHLPISHALGPILKSCLMYYACGWVHGWVLLIQASSSFILFYVLAEAVSQILGSKEKIIKSGSALKLRCLLKRATEKPLYIFW